MVQGHPVHQLEGWSLAGYQKNIKFRNLALCEGNTQITGRFLSKDMEKVSVFLVVSEGGPPGLPVKQIFITSETATNEMSDAIGDHTSNMKSHDREIGYRLIS